MTLSVRFGTLLSALSQQPHARAAIAGTTHLRVILAQEDDDDDDEDDDEESEDDDEDDEDDEDDDRPGWSD